MCICGEKYLTPLFYVEDEWHYKISDVYAKINPEDEQTASHNLMVCCKCHQVFAFPANIIK